MNNLIPPPPFNPAINDDRIPSVRYVSSEQEGNRTTLEEPVVSSQEKKTEKHYFRNRIILLIVLSLIGIAGTSWFATKFSFQWFPRILGPGGSVASVAVGRILNEPAMTGEAWAQCIRKEAQRCSNETILAHFQESYLIAKTQDNNRAKVEQALNSSTQCSLVVSDANLVLRERFISDDGLPWKETCSPHDREAIRRAAGDDVRMGQNSILETFDRGMETIKADVVKQSNWAVEAAVYNRDYVFGNLRTFEAQLILEIQSISVGDIQLPGLEGLITCLVPDEIQEFREVPCPIRPLSLDLRDVQRTAAAYIRVANEQIQLAAMVIATLVERYDWAVGSIQNFVRIIQGVRNIFGRPFDLAWNRLNGPDLSLFGNLPSGGIFVPGDLDFPHIPDLAQMQPFLDALRVEMRKVIEASKDVLEQVSNEVKEKVGTVVKKVTDHFEDFFRNYNPPPNPGFGDATDIGAPIRVIDEKITKARAQVQNSIKNAIKVTNDTPVDVDAYMNNTIAEFEFKTEEFEETKSFFMNVELPDIPEWALTLFDILSKYGGIVDLLGRIWWHIARFRKFFHSSSVPVPIVVVGTPGTDRREEEEQEEKEKRRFWAKITAALLNTKLRRLLGVCAVLIVLGLFGFFLKRRIAVYQDSCLVRPDGTNFATKFVWPTVHNTVTGKGEVALRQATIGLQYQRAEACSVLQATSHVIHFQQQERLFSSDFDYNKTVEEASLILGCVDVSALGTAGNPPEQGLEACSQPRDITLDYGIAECDWPKCEIECNDDDVTASIKQDVLENMCVYEWHVYSEAIIFFVQIAQYWCMWFAIELIELALFALLRKKLRRNSIKWVYEQDMESGEIVGAKGMNAHEAKAQALEKFESREKLVAYAQLTAGLLLIGGIVTVRVYLARIDDFLRPQWFDPEDHM